MYHRILVTGGTAVLGTAVKAIQGDHAESKFVFIGSKDCDLTKDEETLNFIRETRPDAILHLAAVSGGIGLSLKSHATMLRDNVFMMFNILEAARLLNIQKTVMTLTTGMYPADAPLPLKEEYIHHGYPHESNYGSSFAKRLVDPAIRAYREEFGMNVIGLVPNGIFGENDNFNENDAPMVPTLIRRFYEKRFTKDKIEIWGDGTPLREYTYSKDVARAFMWCLDHYDGQQILNIGTTEELTVAEIAFMIADILQVDRSRIVFDKSKPMGIFKKSTDNSRFISLSHFTYTPFQEGLRKTIRWYCDAYENHPGTLRMFGKAKQAKDR
jgi:GDP-L-fucose synthase